ncbi:hypothetical protein CC2G_002617 [Coprinopsis cinerea AmutBmut pab1-1]|nr:hypothetical protein CC2G_002617 [Coprinopsis cinerea AmutBmut pab1-1]
MVETNTTLAKSTIFNERGDFEREIIDPSTLAVAFHLCPVRSIRLMEFEADERLLLLVYSVLEITFVASIHVSTEPDWAVSQRWVVLALLELAAE